MRARPISPHWLWLVLLLIVRVRSVGMSPRSDEPFTCPGCHGGDFPDFDHYCDVLEVPMDKTSIAFAAWLGGKYDWDGDYGPICTTENNK